MFKLLCTASLALALMGPTASADEAEAEACIRTKVWDGYADGWAIRTLHNTTLEAGATKNYLVTLYKGNQYKFMGCGDAAYSNVDLLLYDVNGNVVLKEDATDREPALEYTPEETSTYYVVVHARGLVEDKANGGVAIAVTYR